MRTTTTRRWPARIVAILLLLAAALVIVGVSIESAQGHIETTTTNEHTESGEVGEGHPQPSTSPGIEGATVLGIPLESPILIGGLAVASVVLAAAIWLRPGRLTAVLVIAFSIAAGVFDVAEIQNQAAEDAGVLLAAAVVVVLLRLLTILGSVVILREHVRRVTVTGAAV